MTSKGHKHQKNVVNIVTLHTVYTDDSTANEFGISRPGLSAANAVLVIVRGSMMNP